MNNQLLLCFLILSGTILFCVGCEEKQVPVRDLSCTIYAVHSEIDSLTSPEIKVYIRNDGKEPVLLLKANDASVFGSCIPLCNLEIKKADDKNWSPNVVLPCGNYTGLTKEDFIQLAPGDSFDPFLGLPDVFLDTDLDATNYRDTGVYEIFFEYSTMDRTGQPNQEWDSETKDLYKGITRAYVKSETIRVHVK